MEAQAQVIFEKIIEYFKSRGEVRDIESDVRCFTKSLCNSYPNDIIELTISSPNKGENAITNMYNLVCENYTITIIYHFLFELASYATIKVSLLKEVGKYFLSIKKAMFLYNNKTQLIVQVDNAISNS